jgi:hypothetical protein
VKLGFTAATLLDPRHCAKRPNTMWWSWTRSRAT